MENGEKIKIHERIATLEECQKTQTKKLNNIESQVSNHIPTSIRKLSEKMDEKYSRKWVENFLLWAMRIIIGVVILALLGLVIIK